ncbi:MAG: hypothetical protein KH452_05590 [Clostridiales bacterium]|nr:hypothetical protein [Clostridiales bacterium]
MIHLKKWIFVFPALGVLGMLCVASVRKKDVLPQPDFPLEEEVITAALEKTGLPGLLSESETTFSAEGQRRHVVRSPSVTYSDMITPEESDADPRTRLLVAAVSSTTFGGERVLSTVFDQIDVSDQMAWEDWKQQIVFATLLYGGFEDEEQVYQALVCEEFPYGENSFGWEVQLPGGYCTVTCRTTEETSRPEGKKRASLGVNIFESEELYQRLRTSIP